MMKHLLFLSLVVTHFVSWGQSCQTSNPCISDAKITVNDPLICYEDDSQLPSYCTSDLDCEKVCQFSTSTFSTPLHSGSSYTWSITGNGNILTNNGHSVNILWGAAGSATLTVEETDSTQCITSHSICINIKDVPQASVNIPTGSVFCLNTPIYFESILTNSPSSSSANDSCLWYTIDSTLYNTSVQYHWDFGDGNTSNAQHPMHSYSNSGSYTVTLEVTSDCQCPSTYSLNIVINSTVGPNLSSCSSVICEGDTVSYCTDATSPFWNIDGGSLYASTATDPCVEVIWDNNNNSLNDGAGLLEITDLSSNCLAASPHEIAVIPLNPVIKGPTNPCAGSFEEYSFAAIPGVNYYWGISGWGASIVNGGGTNKILVHWNQSGNFTVNLYMSSSVACPTTNSSKSVQVKPTLWTNTA